MFNFQLYVTLRFLCITLKSNRNLVLRFPRLLFMGQKAESVYTKVTCRKRCDCMSHSFMPKKVVCFRFPTYPSQFGTIQKF